MTGTRTGRDWFPHVSICPRFPRIALKVVIPHSLPYHSPSLPPTILYISYIFNPPCRYTHETYYLLRLPLSLYNRISRILLYIYILKHFGEIYDQPHSFIQSHELDT